MALTTAQKATLKAYILSVPELASQPFNSTGEQVIADALNAAAVPDFQVWRKNVPRTELESLIAFDYALVDNLSVGKARVWEWLFTSGVIDASMTNVRAGIAACWVGSAPLVAVQTAILSACKRSATQVEKLLATGTGTVLSPAVLGFESPISTADISIARAS